MRFLASTWSQPAPQVLQSWVHSSDMGQNFLSFRFHWYSNGPTPRVYHKRVAVFPQQVRAAARASQTSAGRSRRNQIPIIFPPAPPAEKFFSAGECQLRWRGSCRNPQPREPSAAGPEVIYIRRSPPNKLPDEGGGGTRSGSMGRKWSNPWIRSSSSLRRAFSSGTASSMGLA